MRGSMSKIKPVGRIEIDTNYGPRNVEAFWLGKRFAVTPTYFGKGYTVTERKTGRSGCNDMKQLTFREAKRISAALDRRLTGKVLLRSGRGTQAFREAMLAVVKHSRHCNVLRTR